MPLLAPVTSAVFGMGPSGSSVRLFRDLVTIPLGDLDLDINAAIRHTLTRQATLISKCRGKVELVFLFFNGLRR